MPPKIGKRKEKYTGELRRSQLITTYGSGALVDFPHFSGIMAGLDSWKTEKLGESERIHEHNLEKMMGKDYFIQVATTQNEYEPFMLPTYRFPTWYYCPECHRLDTYKKICRSNSNNDEKIKDLVCNHCISSKHPVKLIPSRFVIACLNGHISDFPYVWWAHRKKGKCDNPQLLLEYKGTTGGLDSIQIRCETCGATSTMEGCMSKDALSGLKCWGSMPWLRTRDNKWYTDPEDCTADVRVLQRSANNVYYPVNKSALTIPPFSDNLQHEFARHNSRFEDIFFTDDSEEIENGLKKQFERYPELFGDNLEAFMAAAYRRYGNNEDEEIPDDKSLRCDEYDALRGPDVEDDYYFRTESVEVPDIIKPYITQIKLVKRLREVMVLQGFRRILPSTENDPEKRKELHLFDREFTPISIQNMNWLPAIELYGEGIFIELDSEAVEKWEKINSTRYKKLENRLDAKWIGNNMFSGDRPRYVLLHTLSHLLIRQLSAQCGYATASIKEKIYSSYPDESRKMAGILIYTSATDTDGSLGGLVREGRSDRIGITFEKMLEEGTWCSNDPLCIESEYQGYKGLNYAACHACTLLPETSCEALNCLLDRAAIVGTPSNKDIAFFKEII